MAAVIDFNMQYVSLLTTVIHRCSALNGCDDF